MIQGVAARPRPASSDPLTDGTVRASDLLAAALAPAPRSVSVSWFAGQFASRPERVEGLDGAPYDLATLADDVRAELAHVLPALAELAGVELGVPLELTLSCMSPLLADRPPQHCGLCSKCRERRDAFAAAGVSDPSTYANRSPR